MSFNPWTDWIEMEQPNCGFKQGQEESSDIWNASVHLINTINFEAAEITGITNVDEGSE